MIRRLSRAGVACRCERLVVVPATGRVVAVPPDGVMPFPAGIATPVRTPNIRPSAEEFPCGHGYGQATADSHAADSARRSGEVVAENPASPPGDGVWPGRLAWRRTG